MLVKSSFKRVTQTFLLLTTVQQIMNFTAAAGAPKVNANRQTGTIQIDPPEGVAIKGSMILLHGLGDSSSGWADFAYQMASDVPGLRFVLPTAPSIPVTLNNGYVMPAWYDIKSLDENGNRDCDHLDETKDFIVTLLEKERSKIPNDSKLFLGGFSQGGAVSLYTGLQLPESAPMIDGVLCMSGYLPESEKFKLADRCKGIPVAMHHGTADQVVKMSWAELSKKHLEDTGLEKTIEWHTYPNMPHSACMEELKEVVNWIKKLLG